MQTPPNDGIETNETGLTARRTIPRAPLWRYAIIVLTGLVGVAASVGLYAAIRVWQAHVDELRFSSVAQDELQFINRGLRDATDLLYALRTFMQTSDHMVSAMEYRAFSSGLRDRVAGLRDTAWAPRVMAAERDAFEARVRASGLPDFQIIERAADGRLVRAGNRAEYYPILYSDLAEAGRAVIGYDVASEPVRREAVAKARATDLPAAVPPVALVTGMRTSEGLVAFIPVFRSGSGAARGDGIIVGVFETARMIENIITMQVRASGLDIFVVDPDRVAGQRLIFWHAEDGKPPPAGALQPSIRFWQGSLQMVDQRWTAILVPSQAADPSWTAIATLAGGLAMTLSLVLYLRSSLLRTIELERLTQSLRDTTDELKRNATKLDHMARHDALTGLPNRVMLRETVASGLQRSRRGQGIGVLYLDLDRFKAVNDTLGHPVGDRLLCEVAGRLREGVREVDTIARLGGDEFAIAQFAADQGPDAETLARRLIETVSQPYDIDGHRVVVGVSIGITMSDRDDVDVDQLLRRADMALYAAKRQGRGTWRRFEPGMEHDAHARRGLEMDLRQALETDGLEVYYQPQVSLSSGQVCGFEALLRWHHPHRGLVNPGDFMRCAEETGLIVPIGERVIRDALLQTAQWPKGVRLAVNMSPFQMARDDLVDTIEAALIASGQTGDRLEMEVTEGTILNHLGHAHNALVRLRALGVSVAMDNFGTGAASLSHLRSFPFDRLKIDQSFVAAMTETQQGSAIVRGILQLAASLGIATIAEGVETQQQLDQLARHGCLEAQGFLFGAAQPAMTLNTLIEHRFDLTARRRDVAESQH